MNKKAKAVSNGDRIFNIINNLMLSLCMLAVLYPLWFVIIASFSDPNAIYEGTVKFFPSNPSLEGYRKILGEESIWIGYANTIKYTVIGTLINVVLTLTAAFSLSRKRLPGKTLVMYFIIFTMFFNGGLIPNYILIQKLGWMNTMWALIIPVAVGPWNLIIARTFFQNSISEELCEAAHIDGANHFILFFQIVLPLSKALIAILVLFYSLQHWNSYFSALIYIRDKSKYPLQLVLQNILISTDVSTDMYDSAASMAEKQRLADLIKYGTIIVSVIPILSLYPFVQKYFVQGVMIGAVKG